MSHQAPHRHLGGQAPRRVGEARAASDLQSKAGLRVAAVMAQTQLDGRPQRLAAGEGQFHGTLQTQAQAAHVRHGRRQEA